MSTPKDTGEPKQTGCGATKAKSSSPRPTDKILQDDTPFIKFNKLLEFIGSSLSDSNKNGRVENTNLKKCK